MKAKTTTVTAAKPKTRAASAPKPKRPGAQAVTKPGPTATELTKGLTDAQRAKLETLTAEITACEKQASSASASSYEAFSKKAKACCRLQRLLKKNFPAYMLARFGYGKSHANRWSQAGVVLCQLSPRGDGKFLTSEAHVRPLAGLEPADLESVMSIVRKWKEWSPEAEVTPAWCVAAVQLQLSDPKPNTDLSPKAQVVRNVLELFDQVRESLPTTLNKKAADTIAMFEKEVNELGKPRMSYIGWTQATWNPLHGCQWKSAGCDHCYAAKQMATRLKHRYPGLAETRIVKGKKGYFFTNKILLDPKDLAEPLADRTPKRYFVNSMSDLFHEEVREDFLDAVFDVMERAWWHQYQILTKRPERMAAYSQRRYAEREPPPHIWLGATTENQDAFDQRIKHLVATKTAVRWLSCEPLLGPIDLGDKKQVDWIVVGGESDSKRKMEKDWATSLRDQCKKLGVTFFFKQWGDYSELGDRAKMQQADFRILPTLDGAVHGDYPMEIDLIAIERTANPRGPAGITETLAAMLGSGPRASVR